MYIPYPEVAWLVVEYVIMASFGISIFVNFTTAYEDATGKVIVSPRKIARRYARRSARLPTAVWLIILCLVRRYFYGFFFIDLIATLPFEVLEEDGVASITLLAKLPRILKFVRVARLLRLLKISKLQMYILELEANYVRVCALERARELPL